MSTTYTCSYVTSAMAEEMVQDYAAARLAAATTAAARRGYALALAVVQAGSWLPWGDQLAALADCPELDGEAAAALDDVADELWRVLGLMP